MNRQKQMKIRIAEVVIILVLIIIGIVPQLIGTVEVQGQKGQLKNRDSLKGLNCGVLDERIVERLEDFMKDSTFEVYEDEADITEALAGNTIDFILTDKETAESIVRTNDELMIFSDLINNGVIFSLEKEEQYYVVIRREDYAFGTTSKNLETDKDSNVTIAYLKGVYLEDTIRALYPNATIDTYDTNIDVYTALRAGKCDYAVGYISDNSNYLSEFPEFAVIYEPIYCAESCFCTCKNQRGEKLVEEFNEFLEEISANGELENIENKWKSMNPDNYYIDGYSYTGENGTLNIATGGAWTPMTFYYNGEVMGEFVEICCMFAQEYGYKPEFFTAEYSAELAGVSTGVYDFMADVVENVGDRHEKVNFTKPICYDYNMLYTKADNLQMQTKSKFSAFIDSAKTSFYKNFIEQDRYLMLLKGLWTTIKIAVLTALFGTILGAIICFMRMNQNPFLTGFARLYIKIVQGMPIVVSLMLLYYVVFAKTSFNSFTVATIAFSLDFAAYVSEIFRTGIEAVSERQANAARALGFSKSAAFIKVVLPQAMLHILPVYSGQFIAMVKMTSVVGYIAVQDLTKISDLIRSFTYDAFFPLIVTAIVYFLLASLLLLLLKFVQNKIDPMKRNRFPKGVKRA